MKDKNSNVKNEIHVFMILNFALYLFFLTDKKLSTISHEVNIVGGTYRVAVESLYTLEKTQLPKTINRRH